METTVKGYIKNYIFRNDENGYSVAKLITENLSEIVIVGYFPLVNEELLYEFKGELITHQKYGEQLKVNSYHRIEDNSELGVIHYLSSGTFYGIGPKTASKIVDLLGNNAVKLIIEDENFLAPILSESKRKALREALILEEETYQMFITLLDYGLSNKISNKLFNIYGHSTLSKLEEDPFRLMYEVEGFGFIKSLDVALKFGLTKDDIRTVKAAIIFSLEQKLYGVGDLYLDLEQIKDEVKRLLNIEIEIDEALELLIKEGRLIKDEAIYQLSDVFYSEVNIAQNLLRIKENEIKVYDKEYVEVLLDQIAIQKNIDYTDKQKEAIVSALTSPLTIITGGPGTGKTTLIDGLLNVYANLEKLKENDPKFIDSIALMAPTGRAAKRMHEILRIPAKTIHSTLGYDFDGSFKANRFNPITASLIIIDEASMIDIFLGRRLFDAISETSRVIIVGDNDQLPSVGPGNLLGDIINSNVFNVINLTEIHRQAKDSTIISLASKINNQTLTYDDLISSGDTIFYSGEINQIKDVILNQIKGAINKGYNLIDDIQVLIPQYKGELGIDNMNHLIQKAFNPNYNKGLSMTYGDKTYYKGDKVIQLINDKERLIMNGDIGVINNITLGDNNKPFMEVYFDDNVVIYDQSDLDNLNLAYVISIHKSQGSEYKIVFLPIIRSYLHMLKKELIYTAITRAKEYLLVLGDMKLLVYASNQLSEKRRTKLIDRLNKLKGNITLFNSHDNDDNDNNEEVSPYDFL